MIQPRLKGCAEHTSVLSRRRRTPAEPKASSIVQETPPDVEVIVRPTGSGLQAHFAET